MSDTRANFESRLSRLEKKRKKARVYPRSAFVDSDGYVIVRGYQKRRSFPMLGLVLLAVGFFGLKGGMMMQMGLDGYAAKIDRQSQSENAVANLGVWTLRPDPVSELVAEQLNKYL